jgi:hypothetical protein
MEKRQRPFIGGVNGDYPHIDLNERPIEELKRRFDLFQSSYVLVETISLRWVSGRNRKGWPNHSTEAFERNVACMAKNMDFGIARMQQKSNQ